MILRRRPCGYGNTVAFLEMSGLSIFSIPPKGYSKWRSFSAGLSTVCTASSRPISERRSEMTAALSAIFGAFL